MRLGGTTRDTPPTATRSRRPRSRDATPAPDSGNAEATHDPGETRTQKNIIAHKAVARRRRARRRRRAVATEASDEATSEAARGGVFVIVLVGGNVGVRALWALTPT